MGLNLYNPLGFPFLLKAFLLRPFANGAVPLFAVNFIKRVSFFTHRFLRVYVSGRSRILKSIFSHSYALEMLRVNAIALAASVVDDKPRWDFNTGQIKRYPMRSSQRPFKEKNTVSVFVLFSYPFNTICAWAAVKVKSFNFFFGNQHLYPHWCHGTTGCIGN